VVEVWDDITLLVRCLDVELGLILRVFPKQAEEDGIENRGLADTIPASDSYNVLTELEFPLSKAFEVGE
jgi:hypothetical protein